MTYTQGPWTIESMSNDLNDGQAEVILANRKTIAWTSNTEVSPIDPMYERLNDDGLLDGSCGYTSDEDRANARLIASAPDLLFCLQTLLREKAEEYGDPNDLDWIRFADCDPSGAWHSAYQTINKATGAEVEA